MSANNPIGRVNFRFCDVDQDYISRWLSSDDAFDSFWEFYRNVENLNTFKFWPSGLRSREGTREQLWQSSFGRRKTSIEEDSFSTCKHTVIVDFLKAKTTDKQISETRKTSAVLSIFLLPRWSAVSILQMLLDAKFLLQRCEFCIYTFP